MADKELTQDELLAATSTGWTAPAGSPYRNLTAEEVREAVLTAQKVKPPFGGEHNASWEEHHPVMRAVWGSKG